MTTHAVILNPQNTFLASPMYICVCIYTELPINYSMYRTSVYRSTGQLGHNETAYNTNFSQVQGFLKGTHKANNNKIILIVD